MLCASCLPSEEKQNSLSSTCHGAAGLQATRPRLVKGYEALVMARLVLEDPSGKSIEAILADWEGGLLPATLQAWGEEEGQLAKVLEATRSSQLGGNPGAWIGLNQPYPGVQEALKDCPYPW